MKHWTSTIWVLGVLAWLGLLAGCSAPLAMLDTPMKAPQPSQTMQDDWFKGQILIGYDSQSALDDIVARVGGQVSDTLSLLNVAVVALPAGVGVAQALTTLNLAHPQGMRYVEPNYIRQRIQPQPGGFASDDLVAATESIPQPSQGVAYSDPLRHRQWALDIMNAQGAWSQASGRGTLIGVVDTGIDGTHPDLVGKQVTGMDCLSGRPIPPDVDGTMQANTHATHVAGIAAAWGNNGEGIVGVAPEAQIMSLIIFNPLLEGPGNGSGYVGDANVARCILYAAVTGPDGVEDSGDEADVLNNSWGGKSYGQTLTDAINKAVESGTAFVVSKGNSGEDEMRDPARLPGVIAVGATMAKDRKTDFSTMGPNISVGAPGEDVLSSVPMWLLQPDGTPYGYQYFNGTSMAAPQVSGAVALLREKFPEATPYQLQKILEQTADDIETPGYDRNTGWGRINLARALAVSNLPPDGASVVVHAVTGNAGADGEAVGVPTVDVILRQGRVDRYFAQTNAQGQARFFNVEPGAYDVLVTGGDVIMYNFRPANRVAARSRVVATSGSQTEVTVTLDTSMTVTATWSGTEDVDLLVGEPGPDEQIVWVGERVSPSWGAFTVSGGPAGGMERYTLLAEHFPYALYPLAVSAQNAAEPVEVSVTVEQNGVIESYGPYVLQPGEVLESSEWYDWWENFPDPDRGFGQPGPGAPWVY